MIKNELIAKLSGFWFYYRWHPAIALRYLPIVREINNSKVQKTVLEVGSGGLGIAPYLRREITGVDIDFQPPYHPYLNRIKADASKLPFSADSFDVVISSDMLEHLNKKDRENAISEMIRVAKDKVIIGVPCGSEAYKQDQYLDSLYQALKNKRYHFLEEQITLGLPDKKEISDTIFKSAKLHNKSIKLKIKGNENLGLRQYLMKGWMNSNIIANLFYRKLMLLFLPLMKNMNQEPVYRQIFFIDIK